MKFRMLQENLRRLLLARIAGGEFTGVSLAARTGFQQAHISNFLNNKRNLSLDAMDHVLKALGLSVLDLVPADAINRRATIATPDEGQFEGVMLVDPHTAASRRRITTEDAADALRFKKSFLRRLRTDCATDRNEWTRFVLIKADAQNALAMHPRMTHGATLLIDRHYNSLKPYRRNEPNIYVVRKGNEVLVRYATLHGAQLALRPQNESAPLDFVSIPAETHYAEFIIGRICHIGMEI